MLTHFNKDTPGYKILDLIWLVWPKQLEIQEFTGVHQQIIEVNRMNLYFKQ